MSENTWTQSLVGRSFNGYRIVGLISRGGMGIVYEGVQESLGRPVAIKVLYPHFSDDHEFRERFTREAQAVAYLSHPNIVRIIDFGSEGDLYYIVLDLVSGGSLRNRLADVHAKGLIYNFENTIKIIGQVGAALEYAHLHGYIHRDVKPGNILLGDNDHAYLTDFGITRLVSESQMTAAGALLGTPDYMAPEQSLGTGPVGPAADQYSLAIVAYEMFAGRVPFSAHTPTAVLQMQIAEPPPPLRSIYSWYSPQIDAVLMKALSKSPDQRYGSVLLFVEHLEEAAAGMETVVEAAALPPAGQEDPAALATSSSGAGSGGGGVPASTGSGGSNYTPWILALVALAFVVATIAIAGGGYYLLSDDDEEPTATQVAENQTPTQAEGQTPESTTPVVEPTLTPVPEGQATGAASEPANESPTEEVATTPTEPVAATGTSAEGGGDDELIPVILFASNRESAHDSQIYAMNPDGSDQRQLTFASGHSWGPRISHDGQFFFFSSTAPGDHEHHGASGGGLTGEGNHDIYSAESNGQNIENITSAFPSWDNGWSWSPDDQLVTFTSDRDTTEDLEEANWEIYVMSADGSNVRRLTFNNAADGWPSWTPDGEHIVFYSERGGDGDIYIMDRNGENVEPLIERSGTIDTHPYVSPDGTKIVFSSQNPNTLQGEIYIANIDGTEITRLTNTAANNYAPSFSPDGTKVVFASNRDGNDEIYVMNIDGSGLTRLTNDPGEDTTPSWGFIVPSS